MSDAAPPQPSETPEPETPERASWHLPRMIAAWVIAVAIGVLVIVLVPGPARVEWLALAVGVSALITFALQLGTAQREGFITRTSFSVAGSVLIIAVIDGVSVLVG
ncbi:MAG: hypothetical protein ACNYNX_05845 [Leucobacter sp.]